MRRTAWLRTVQALLQRPALLPAQPLRTAVTQAVDEAERARLGFVGGAYSLDEFPVNRIRCAASYTGREKQKTLAA